MSIWQLNIYILIETWVRVNIADHTIRKLFKQGKLGTTMADTRLVHKALKGQVHYLNNNGHSGGHSRFTLQNWDSKRAYEIFVNLTYCLATH